MKIDNDGLKSLYRAHVHSQTPPSREGCPSAEKILRLLRSQSSRKEGTRIIDHISRCRFCAEEFDFLVENLRNEKEFIRDVQPWLGEKENADIQRPFFSRFSWALAALVVGFAVVGVLLLRFVAFPPAEKYRAEPAPKIELLQPGETKIARASLVFRWKAVEKAEYYVLEVFDQALAPVWESGKIPENYAVPPRELIRKLAAGQSYFWTVSATFSDGGKIMSSLKEFVLAE